MSIDRQRLERLKIEIELKRAALAEHRAELLKLEKEVEGFAQQYAKIVGPLEAELDSVRQQIEELQSFTSFSNSGLWGGYASFEESFDAKYRRPPNEPIRPLKSSRPVADENSLRTLYRKLARKFHPDTTTDHAEKARLTVIMAQVNAAYRAKNMDELLALNGQRKEPPPTPPVPLTEPNYNDLIKLAQLLDEEITWTQIVYNRLLNGPLMALKIEHSLAKSRGRDLLKEIAAKVRADLDAAKAELASLRRH